MIKNKNHRAHRFIFELVVRSLEPGEIVLHSCDNTKCVKLEHLRGGTPLENMHDAMDKGRKAKILTEDMVREIRARRASGQTYEAIAAAMRINSRHARRVGAGLQWRQVQ
jgi:hypothetical protein